MFPAQQTPSVKSAKIVNKLPTIIPATSPDSIEEYKIKLPNPTLTNFNVVQPVLSLYNRFIVIKFQIQNSINRKEKEVTIVTVKEVIT